jgi:tetratricopeptide (TPR) repeat protein
MPADREHVRNRVLGLIGLWLFLSGLLSALSFVEVALVGFAVLLVAALVAGAVWLLRSSEIPWRLGELVVVVARAVRRLGVRLDDLGIPLRLKRLGIRVGKTVAGVLTSAGSPVRRLGLRVRDLGVRQHAKRLGVRARQGAAGVPGRADVLLRRGVRTYAIAVYGLQRRTAEALHAGSKLANGASRLTPRPAGARRRALRLNALGAQLRRRGEHEQAAEQHRVALAIVRDLGDEQVEALTLNNLALALAQAGAEEEAVEHLEHARVVLHELGDEEHEGQVIANLGLVHRRQGHSEEAVTLLHEALEKLPRESTAYRQVEEELVRAS